MNVPLFKALIALFPACLLLSGSTILFFRRKTLGVLMQLVGAGCMVVVVFTHICEALHLFPWRARRSCNQCCHEPRSQPSLCRASSPSD
jgi:hypothetical protein